MTPRTGRNAHRWQRFVRVSAAAPGAMGVGEPWVSHWAAAAETDQCGGTTLALATECLAIAAVGHRALSARRAVFPVGYCSCALNSKGPYFVRPSDGDDGSSISTMWHPIASGRMTI